MASFFDTSVLIYAVDEDHTEKFGLAGELVETHLVEGDGMISVQVLKEIYSAARKLRRPLSDQQAREMVAYFSAFRTLPEDARMEPGTVQRSQELKLSFWDAKIVEDMQHGQVIEGMRVENPFL